MLSICTYIYTYKYTYIVYTHAYMYIDLYSVSFISLIYHNINQFIILSTCKPFLLVADDTYLSTRAVVSPEGTILHQYSVMVCGVAVCLNYNSVFYVNLTEPPQRKQHSPSVEQRLQDIRKILEDDSSVKVKLAA